MAAAKQKWVVTGELPVNGHAQGEEFEHDFLEHEAEALVASGAIKPAKKTADKE